MSGAREHTERVEQLVEMGFARDKAVSALKRANNDIAVAMNFLFDGQDGDGDDEMPALLSSAEIPGDTNVIRAELPLNSEPATGIPYNNYNHAYANPTAPTAQLAYAPSAATFAAAPTPIGSSHVPVAQPATWGLDATALDNKPPAAGTGSREDQQLQEALALSLKEQNQQQVIPLPDSASRIHGVSKEDEEMARAIEQSLQAEGGGGDFGVDSKDPSKLVKEPGTAVGLKNIGNTCYCNSLLQTYWAIGAFREAIIRSPVPAAPPGVSQPPELPCRPVPGPRAPLAPAQLRARRPASRDAPRFCGPCARLRTASPPTRVRAVTNTCARARSPSQPLSAAESG